MDVDEVPQEGNRTLGGHRKAVYARDADGHVVIVASRGSEVDETVTLQAVDWMNARAEDARARALAGACSPLEYWMWRQRMDVALLSQVTGLWQWRIRRHFRPQVFARLSPRVVARYADALGLEPATLGRLP
jgi:hypothetical protein